MFLLSKKLLVLIVTFVLLFGNERRQSAEGLKCWVCETTDENTPGNQVNACTSESKEYSKEIDDKAGPVCALLEGRNKTTNDVGWVARLYDINSKDKGEIKKCEKLEIPPQEPWNITICFCNQDDCNKGAINGVGLRGDESEAGGSITGSFEGNGIALSVSLVLLVGTKFMI